MREEAIGAGDEDEDEMEVDNELAPEFREIRSEELRANFFCKARSRQIFKAIQVRFVLCMDVVICIEENRVRNRYTLHLEWVLAMYLGGYL